MTRYIDTAEEHDEQADRCVAVIPGLAEMRCCEMGMLALILNVTVLSWSSLGRRCYWSAGPSFSGEGSSSRAALQDLVQVVADYHRAEAARIRAFVPDDDDSPEAPICPTCNGSGEGQNEGVTCRPCRGSGMEGAADDER